MENNQGESSGQNNLVIESTDSESENENNEQPEQAAAEAQNPIRRPMPTAAASLLRRVRLLVSQNAFLEDELDNDENNYPRRGNDNESMDESSSDDEEHERLFEEYINQAQSNDDRTDFDSDLPIQHSYLGDTETVRGLTLYEENKEYDILVTPHHSWVFPGEIVPMILTRFVPRDTKEDDEGGLNIGVVFEMEHDRGRESDVFYGVTCQVYEKGIDNRGNCIFKGKSYQRFVVVNAHREEIFSMRNRVFRAKVRILPEIILSPPEPIQLAMSNYLLKFNSNSNASKKAKKFAAASTRFPSFVYNRFSSKRINDKIESCMGVIRVEPPKDPILKTFWFARNLPFNEHDQRKIFLSNCVNERLMIIDEKLETGCSFLCKRCYSKIANFSSIFPMSRNSLTQIYCNPSGYQHETLTVTKTIDNAVKMVDRPSTEYSWFPNYAWQIAICSHCQTHVGWRFIAVKNKNLRPRHFFGLTAKSLIVNPEVTKTEEEENEEELRPSLTASSSRSSQ